MPFRKQNSFEVDDSLGILTPDQMKEFLDSNVTNPHADLMLRFSDGVGLPPQQQCRIDATPSPEELPLDPIEVIATAGGGARASSDNLTGCIDDDNVAATYHHPVEPSSVSSALGGVVVPATSSIGDDTSQAIEQPLSQHSDSDSKNDSMTKSTASKASNSFITSVTSIASLDTGYQGDGEMSRPASRGAGAHSPSGTINGSAGRLGQMSVSRSGSQEQPHQLQQREQQQRVQRPQQQPHQIEEMLAEDGQQHQQPEHNDAHLLLMRPVIVPHRQPRVNDPMTDSDFFTESDADDAVNRNAAAAAGDRRAQVIDGQLYGGAGGAAMDGGAGADVYIGRHANGDDANAVSMTEDSCMESSGIFTDVENRGDDDLGMVRSIEHDGRDDSDDMSPDASTDTIKSQPHERAGGCGLGGDAIAPIVEGEFHVVS